MSCSRATHCLVLQSAQSHDQSFSGPHLRVRDDRRPRSNITGQLENPDSSGSADGANTPFRQPRPVGWGQTHQSWYTGVRWVSCGLTGRNNPGLPLTLTSNPSPPETLNPLRGPDLGRIERPVGPSTGGEEGRSEEGPTRRHPVQKKTGTKRGTFTPPVSGLSQSRPPSKLPSTKSRVATLTSSLITNLDLLTGRPLPVLVSGPKGGLNTGV